jgi:hypothetical protein
MGFGPNHDHVQQMVIKYQRYKFQINPQKHQGILTPRNDVLLDHKEPTQNQLGSISPLLAEVINQPST